MFGKPRWGNVAKQTHCAVHMSDDATELGQTTRLVLRAVQDNKYDGRQFRQLSLSLTVAKRTDNNMEIITKTAFRIPVRDIFSGQMLDIAAFRLCNQNKCSK